MKINLNIYMTATVPYLTKYHLVLYKTITIDIFHGKKKKSKNNIEEKE